MESTYELIEAAKNEILEAIKSSRNSVIRSHHTRDKVAKVLVNLVNAVTQTCGDSVWKCPECSKYAAWNWDQAQEAGTPMCSECDIDMELMEPAQHIFETDEWKEADAYVLRITQIKNSKKDKS